MSSVAVTMADAGGAPQHRAAGDDQQIVGGQGGSLTEAQSQVLDRCLLALRHAKNDSHTLAALLLITRLCPASQLDRLTLHRIFEAVGFNFPARLLMTAIRGDEDSSLPPYQLLSLSTALLAALSTDQDLVSNPQLLATIPLLLGVLANGLTNQRQDPLGTCPDCEIQSGDTSDSSRSEEISSMLDEAVAADCYQVLAAVCALPRGPAQLLSRGAVPSLCQAVNQNQTLSQQRGLVLLGHLLTAKTRHKAWSMHSAELLALLLRLCKDFCQSSDLTRLDMCTQLVQFLPPAGVEVESEELRATVSSLWGALRPLLQAKLTAAQIGSVLVLSACLLDLYGWELVGPPKFCCLLVNRACVEVRMGLEEPPGTDMSPELQHTLTGCYRILEASIQQACSTSTPTPPGLSLHQSRQVLLVLEEAVNAVMYHLQQVGPGHYDDPFVFATFRCLCSWLAEETSCLKQQVMASLLFLIGYARHHLQGGASKQVLSDWLAEASTSKERGAWTSQEPLRYLLPALCHLSAEEDARKVLLTLDTPALLVDFLSQSWTSLTGMTSRDPSMETACSTLLNFIVTETERVRTDPAFRTLEVHLTEALPVLVNKPHLLVLTTYYCTLGLMIGRLECLSGSLKAGQRRFFSVALQFLCGALDSGSGTGLIQVSAGWEVSWDEVAVLWRLCIQALGGCVRARPETVALVREVGWLRHTLAMLAVSSALPDRLTEEVLEEVLCTMAEQCLVCRQEIRDTMRRRTGGALNGMKTLEEN